MKNFLRLLFVILSFATLFASAQTVAPVHSKEMTWLAFYGDSLLKANSDSTRIASQQHFKQMMDSIVRDPSSFNTSFTEIKNLSVLTSDDKKIKVYSWMKAAVDKMSYDFYGYVQVMNEKKVMKVYELKEKKYLQNDETEFLKLSDTAWFGALYYKLLQKKFDNKIQYILLGWQGRDLFSTRKVIDYLNVTTSKIEFGKPVFKSTGKAKYRVILEYNSQASVSVNYNSDVEMIIQDHLAPSDPRPEAKGMLSLYGPDLSYDGWKFKEGLWYLQKNVVVHNKKEDTEKNVKLKHDFRMQRKEQ